jgi:hypothetical protein
VRDRWWKWTAVAAAVTTICCGAVATASAAGEPDTGAFNAFALKASNGYKLLVLASSKRGYRHGEVLILVTGKAATVSYLAPATVTDTKVEADLGGLGRIALEFVPSGSEGVDHPVCDRSQRVPYEKGSYVGTFEFHGEEGYTDVSLTEVPFSLHPWIDFICGGVGTGELSGHGLPGARLAARSQQGQEHLAFRAIQNRPGARVYLEASVKEERGPIRIDREVQATSPASAFEFTSDVRFAALRPDAPFSGTGAFHRNAKKANRCTGNLTVDVPGRSNVRLTGDRCQVGLAHARFDREGTFHPDADARLSAPKRSDI